MRFGGDGALHDRRTIGAAIDDAERTCAIALKLPHDIAGDFLKL